MRAFTPNPGLSVGLDIGGTNIDVGVVDRCGQLLSRSQSPLRCGTSVDDELRRVFDVVCGAVRDAGVGWTRIGAIGVAAPGTLDLDGGVIRHAFNLPGWENLPLVTRVREQFGRPAILVNDANAAAYAESQFGSGRGTSSLVLFTLGTGIGSGIVLQGQLWEGAHGHAAECGHMIIQHDGGPQSPFGIHGSLELYASSRALVDRCRNSLQSSRASSLRGLDSSGGLSAQAIASAAEAGDELAVELVMKTADYLAFGAVSVMHVLNPEAILLGGAMTFGRHDTQIGRQFLKQLREQILRQTFEIPGKQTVVDYAALGADAGVIGAAAWASERLRDEDSPAELQTDESRRPHWRRCQPIA